MVETIDETAIMESYKTQPCPSGRHCTQKQSCMKYHYTFQKRRNPFLDENTNTRFRNMQFKYNDVMCIDEDCPDMDDCQKCHNFEELWYHPLRYKTQWWSDKAWENQFCPKVHDTEKPRIPLKRRDDVPQHLNLATFKVQACKISANHNPKHWEFYHSFRDRRRVGDYSVELCENAENWPYGDDCKKSHNRVEQLYHIDKYKTKFCSHYPYNLEKCDYLNFCSFAHSENDIKVELIHSLPFNDVFYMYFFKTVWCPYNSQHDKAQCPYAHNWQDFRRKPQDYTYSSAMCPNWRTGTFILSYEEAGCSDLLKWGACHGWKEQEYHPSNYKIKQCTSGRNWLKGRDCPYFHSLLDRRTSSSEIYSVATKSRPREAKKTPLPAEASFPSMVFSPYSKITSFTPQPPKSLMIPMPGFTKHKSENAENIRYINKNTDGFVLHRRGRNNTLQESNGLSPFAEEFKRTPLGVCNKLQLFIRKYKLVDLNHYFLNLSWEQILAKPDEYFGPHANRVKKAIREEAEEAMQVDQLILDDIAIFTGQKPLGNQKLEKFKLEAEEDFQIPVAIVEDIPSRLRCPLTRNLMHDPVIFSEDGITYEKSALVSYLKKKYSSDDKVSKMLDSISPDRALKEQINQITKDW